MENKIFNFNSIQKYQYKQLIKKIEIHIIYNLKSSKTYQIM